MAATDMAAMLERSSDMAARFAAMFGQNKRLVAAATSKIILYVDTMGILEVAAQTSHPGKVQVCAYVALATEMVWATEQRFYQHQDFGRVPHALIAATVTLVGEVRDRRAVGSTLGNQTLIRALEDADRKFCVATTTATD
jgi:hypothetical protein